MSDYGTMQTRIANELAKSGLTSEIKLAIKSAVAHYQRHHFWFLEEVGTFNTVNGTEYYPLASNIDYVEHDSVVITVSGSKHKLTKRGMGYIDSISTNTSLTGIPVDYCFYKDSLRLYPIPNSAYTVTVSYTKIFTALSADGDTNAFMIDAEELIRSHAKADLYANVLRDAEGFQAMKVLEKFALDNIEAENSMKLSTGTITPTYF